MVTKGCKIILIKNVNFDFKITNCIEGEYIDHSDFVLLMKTTEGTIITIPKMKQKVEKLENHNTHVYWTQFPVLLGYAVTVLRVQGATVKKTHLYLDHSMFCEGQAYVALSRVKTADSVHILKFDKNAFKANMEIVDLLDYANRNKSMKNYTYFNNETLNTSYDELNNNNNNTNTDDTNKKVIICFFLFF